MRAAVAMGAEIDHEGAGGDLDLVGAQEEDEIERAGVRHVGCRIAALASARRSRCRGRPAGPPRLRCAGSRSHPAPSFIAPELDRGLGGQRRDGGTVGTRERPAANEEQGMRGPLERCPRRRCPAARLRQRFGPGPEIGRSRREVGALADQADRKIAGPPALADAGIEHRRFPARIGSHNEQRIGTSRCCRNAIGLNRKVALPQAGSSVSGHPDGSQMLVT